MTQADKSHIFRPGRIGVVDLSCRAVVAPMTRVSSDPGGVPNAVMRDYYEAYALGGFGLIISEGTYPDRVYAQGYRHQPGMTDDAQQGGWREVVETVHRAGSKIFQQLMHAGALSQHNDYAVEAAGPSTVQPVGEMAANYFGDGLYKTPRALSFSEIEAIKQGFAAAAMRSVAAGFDGIEIHGANGYLLHQFFSATANQRDDDYGGPADNRARLHVEVLTAIKEAVGPNVPVGMRVSQLAVNDFGDQWAGGERDARVLFSALASAGVDYLHVNSVPATAPVFGGAKTLAGHARDYYDGPIIACGALHDPETADQFIVRGGADFFAMARGALADPAWPRKVAAGETPISFDPGMTQPLATIENTRNWRAAHS